VRDGEIVGATAGERERETMRREMRRGGGRRDAIEQLFKEERQLCWRPTTIQGLQDG
jgi:hypothetical protein